MCPLNFDCLPLLPSATYVAECLFLIQGSDVRIVGEDIVHRGEHRNPRVVVLHIGFTYGIAATKRVPLEKYFYQKGNFSLVEDPISVPFLSKGRR